MGRCRGRFTAGDGGRAWVGCMLRQPTAGGTQHVSPPPALARPTLSLSLHRSATARYTHPRTHRLDPPTHMHTSPPALTSASV